MTTSLSTGDKPPGLYLRMADGEELALTAENIGAATRALFADAKKVPPSVHEADAFHLCSICPLRGSGDTCHAIRPILAVWDRFDRYPSHEPVTVEYRAMGSEYVVAAETTLQRALQYVSVMSLMYYCEVGKQYWRYFCGTHPLMAVDDLVSTVYLNMFWASQGDVARTHKLIDAFHRDITTTTQCQMARLKLICHSDSFLT